jgi:anti-anti-sigma regulatory factor
MSHLMLRISVYEYETKIGITLEGRVAGPWVAELSRVWVETAPQLNNRELILDIRNVTYADAAGVEALKAIYAQSQARLITGSLWAEYLAKEITDNKPAGANEEVEHANHV